jgi:metallophosphoesterase superfamily enzyme
MEWVNEKLIIGNCVFSHHPVPAEGRINVYGHLHPCIRIRHGQESLRLPCFAVKKDTIILPSFGAFTGCSEILLKTGERGYAIGGNSVIHVPTGMIQVR